MDGEKKKPKFSVGYLIIAFWVVLLLQQVLSGYLQPTRTSYSDFKAAVDGDKVEEVAIGQTLIRGHMKAPPRAARDRPADRRAPVGQQRARPSRRCASTTPTSRASSRRTA